MDSTRSVFPHCLLGKKVKLCLNSTTGDLVNKETIIRQIITTNDDIKTLVIGDKGEDPNTYVPYHNVLYIEELLEQEKE